MRSSNSVFDPTRQTGSLLARCRTTWPRLVGAFESSWLAYPLLFILQLKVIWGMWSLRDVTTGDTVSYFTTAWRWYIEGSTNIAWSPLYTSFYGSFLFINSDPVWATFAHRVVIVLTTTVLVLAVLRQLLPAGIAWLCAAWWAVLPLGYNTLYEVHLFAAIPVLTAWLLMLTATGPWRRAASLATFALSAVLVRNEMSVATGVLGLVLAVYEWRRLRRGEGIRIFGTLLAYATALCLAASLCGAAYAVSCIKYPALSGSMKHKHTLNMAQVYAYGYQQRHPEWTLSPWIECQGLMQDTFECGSELPTLREMLVANPRAVAEHFVWNLSLTPNGLQLLLFNRAYGSVTPDYDTAVLDRLNNPWAGVLTGGILALWTVGFVVLWKGRREWWHNWMSTRALGWAAMIAVAAVVPLVILTQRPRPSYLFAFAVLLIAITGMSLHVVSTRWRLAERLRSIAPVVMVALVLFVPRHFVQGKHQPPAWRGVADQVQRLLPYRDLITSPGTVTVVSGRESVGWYLHPMSRKKELHDEIQVFGEIVARLLPGESFSALLVRHGVDYLYLGEHELAWLKASKCEDAAEFINGRAMPRWEVLASGDKLGDRWRVYHRLK